MNKIRLAVFLVSLVAALSACGGGGGGGGGDVTMPPKPASFSVEPASGSTIKGATQISVVFERSMNPASLAVGGAMAAQAVTSWTQTSFTNDTLTIAPTDAWSEGVGRSLTIDVRDAKEVPVSTLNLAFNVDTTAPLVLSVTPANNAVIGTSHQVVIVFNESMHSASTVLGGSMDAEDDGGVWSSTNVGNDTLTVSPASEWAEGSRTLTVNASDAAGNVLAQLNLSFSVDSTTPTATVSPANGANIAATAAIKITFNEAMETGALVLQGSLADQSPSSVWSTTSVTGDTLTITPGTSWTKGLQTLTVSVADVAGNALLLNLSYGADAVFVSTSGEDANAGTSSQPLRSIQAGIDRAVASGMRSVLIQAGTYSGSFTMEDGLSVEGGYDIGWSQALPPANLVTVQGGLLADDQAVTVNIEGISMPARLSALRLVGANAIAPLLPSDSGRSAYVVRIINSSGVTLTNLELIAGDGATGGAGVHGTSILQAAASGGAGVNASPLDVSCDDSTRKPGGNGAGTGSNRAGGNGGPGGKIDSSCSFPQNFTATSGETGLSAAIIQGLAGTGGAGGPSCDFGQNGRDGLPGSPGPNGNAVSQSGGIVSTGYWVPVGSGSSGLLGSNGTGGGGGGGSGGCDVSPPDQLGAGGGGGGAGGLRSPIAGGGGGAGGWSIGVFARDSEVTINDTSIQLSRGGDGGRGGNGGSGQPGGSGGPAGMGFGAAKAGGAGGKGGKGGDSGAGSGGAAGSAVGILYSASTVTTYGVTFSGGATGAFGAGGTVSGSSAPSGTSGGVWDILSY